MWYSVAPFSRLATQKSAKSKTGEEICQNWNRDKYKFWALCTHLHVCRVCIGSLPFSQCCNSGPCKGKGKVIISLEYFECNLSNHPNIKFVKFIIDGISIGLTLVTMDTHSLKKGGILLLTSMKLEKKGLILMSSILL